MEQQVSLSDQFAVAFESLAASTKRLSWQVRQVSHQTNRMLRPIHRIGWTPGDRHVDAVCQSILRGETGYTTSDPAVRLNAAQGFAEVLDGTWQR